MNFQETKILAKRVKIRLNAHDYTILNADDPIDRPLQTMILDQPTDLLGFRTTPPTLADANCIVLCLDGKGRVIFLNSFGLEFFGYRESEIVGLQAVGTIIPEKDDQGKHSAAMIDDLLHRPDGKLRYIYENRYKNGNRTWIDWSNRAFRDETGNVTHIVCVGIDIRGRNTAKPSVESYRDQPTAKIHNEHSSGLRTANIRLLTEIQKYRDRYRLFSEASSEGILFHDNGIAIEANEAFADLVAYPRDQLMGMDIIRHFVASRDQEGVRRKMTSADDRVYEITARSATGRQFPVEVRSRAGELAGRPCRVSTVRDITQRKKTERALIQSQKMEAVSTLAGGIAHDFNNMLAGIQGNVEIIRRQLSPNSTHQKHLSIIGEIVERGAKLSGQLLGYARGGQAEICEINLNRLVENTLDMFGHTQRQITIQTRLDPYTPNVRGDQTQIEQVLLNLIINATHAMPSGGHLFIETHNTVLSTQEDREYEIIPGRYAMLSVRDTGHGFDQETQKQIFEPFFTTKAEGQGTGLGLASTYGIVKNHKGYIEVYSEPGVGSQFNVLLPASDCTDKATADMGATIEKGKETILIVDDEPDFLEVGREMLLLLGYAVITASGSEEAVARFEKQAGIVKLVIMDMIMPGPPVDETIRQLKKIDSTVRILLFSGHSQNGEVVQKIIQSGDGFIQKPFRLASLSKKIREIMDAAKDENP